MFIGSFLVLPLLLDTGREFNAYMTCRRHTEENYLNSCAIEFKQNFYKRYVVNIL